MNGGPRPRKVSKGKGVIVTFLSHVSEESGGTIIQENKKGVGTQLEATNRAGICLFVFPMATHLSLSIYIYRRKTLLYTLKLSLFYMKNIFAFFFLQNFNATFILFLYVRLFPYFVLFI